MSPRYEYEFVRLEQAKNWFTQMQTPSQEARDEYQEVVHKYARQGWRLVQIFAPSISIQGMAAYFELIFERPVE